MNVIEWRTIDTAPSETQIMLWEPMYGWLIGARIGGKWQLKSSGNFWVDLPEEVVPTQWHPLLPPPEYQE